MTKGLTMKTERIAPGEWLPAAEAAALLGKSERQLARKVEQGIVRKKVLPRMPGQSNPTPVFSASDIRALLAGKPHLYEPPNGGVGPAMRLQIAPGAGLLLPPNPTEETGDGEPGNAADREPRPWLTAAEAADYSGLPVSYLVWAAEQQLFAALDVGIRPGGRWRFHRDSLAALPGEPVS